MLLPNVATLTLAAAGSQTSVQSAVWVALKLCACAATVAMAFVNLADRRALRANWAWGWRVPWTVRRGAPVLEFHHVSNGGETHLPPAFFVQRSSCELHGRVGCLDA